MHFPIGRSRLSWVSRNLDDGPFGCPSLTSDESSLTTQTRLVK